MNSSDTFLMIVSLACILTGFSKWKDSSMWFIGLGILLVGTSNVIGGALKVSIIAVGSVCMLISVIITLRHFIKNKQKQSCSIE